MDNFDPLEKPSPNPGKANKINRGDSRKSSKRTGFLGKYVPTLIIALVIINILLLIWCSYKYGLFNVYPTKETSGRTTVNLNKRPKHSSTQSLPSILDENAVETTSSGFQLISCADDSLAAAVAKARPAVVYIKTTVTKRNVGPNSSIRSSALSFDSATERINGSTKNSIGSGVIFDPKGYILTNYHVIAGAEEVEVTPFGYKEMVYPARIVKADQESDLAILKIDSQEKFPCATLGNSDLIEVADTVLAIGSPFGLEHTVTKGIISDNKRDLTIDETEYKEMIQTDAAINRGNSGGPLINGDGEVVGINTAIYAPTGIFTGIGFAIPINKAKLLLIRSGELIND